MSADSKITEGQVEFDDRDHRINSLMAEVIVLRKTLTIIAQRGENFGADWCQTAARGVLKNGE